ncbi:hypothetical protein G4B88_025933 [Cannabis sativa]|uniref:RNase H type-1 domain-containing protein n=1 Tax=Cannabis sativa TaxID=3483 RepID=A0A7J6HFC9_CANSA|nr:hypothetical protein G4B88_025933 [Cannabis sativa]
MGCTFSAIWDCRNKLVCKGERIDLGRVLTKISSTVQDMLHHMVSSRSNTRVGDASQVQVHLQTHVVLFVDAFWGEGVMGAAMIKVENAREDWYLNSCQCSAGSALEAELKAIRFALEWALQNNWTEISILYDSQVVVNALQKRNCIPSWPLTSLSLSFEES